MTSNSAKVQSLKLFFERAGRPDINIIQEAGLNIPEVQADTVEEVSKAKAEMAHQILKKPVLVEDGGLSIPALNGFPGVYTKYILETIGVAGILKLMNGRKDREAKWLGCTTFIDQTGTLQQFRRKGGDFTVAHVIVKGLRTKKSAWSALGEVIYIPEYAKMMSEMTDDEWAEHKRDTNTVSSIDAFASWYLKQHPLPPQKTR